MDCREVRSLLCTGKVQVSTGLECDCEGKIEV